MLHDSFIRIVQKDVSHRKDNECFEMVPWLKGHCPLFANVPQEIVADVIRHCEFERRHKNDVLIKQGESGDKLYIILKGQVSIYVITDQKDTPRDVLAQVDAVCSKHDLERENLGQYVWSAGEGKSFGEVALLKEDCIRTATVVADNETDLVVIDRALYNRSVRDVLEREYTQKNEFVDTNLLFKNWPARQKKLLVVALKKETAKYGSQVIRQGGPADHMYFLLSGEIEITCDQSQFKGQFEEQWRDMETLLPGLLPRGHNHTETPLEALKRKKSHHKLIQMCLLGTNEIIGAIDILLGLPTYLDNAMVTREAEVLVLSRENYSRLFTKKAAQATVATLRERLTMRLYLYIHRSEGLVPPVQSPFLKYLTFLLHDENAVMELRRMKRKEIEEKRGLRHARDEEDTHMSSKEAERMSGMLKMLDIKPGDRQNKRLPSMESSQRVINEIDAGLKGWVERSRGDSPHLERRDGEADGVRKRHMTFHGPLFIRSKTDFLRPNIRNTKHLSRSKTPTDPY
ncbi:uncharacterized protein LOC128220453 isoform X2 [Mya arenaria]|uniref:uncharacterized protein LOC128220453 isoform X2 n=1 Tax=Mya arenaria TaxID=6604 RepID=UPI0022E2F10D|nr:uncharacterized protein LOC128220453 isoform X2 [Mya arenaria]